MTVRRVLLAFGLVLGAIVVATVDAVGSVRACSCSWSDPVDALSYAEVVFTGTVLGNDGDDREPRWRFQIDGVVKGEVEPIEMVSGDDWAVGCGTDFGRFTTSIAVYATRNGDGLHANGCAPTPSRDELEQRLAEFGDPTGTGPPIAVVSGTVGPYDLHLVDRTGRTVARGSVGVTGAVAHCPGTTSAVIVTADPQSIAVVDLESFSVVHRRDVVGPFAWVGDRVQCAERGGRVVMTAGYGPDTGALWVVSSTADGEESRTFDDASRAVPHPDGTVIVLPSRSGVPLRTLDASSLRPLDGGETSLPDDVVALDGDVSPDGMRLVLLTAEIGSLSYDAGATEVMVVELRDGVPTTAGEVDRVPLVDPGITYESDAGAAKWIRWVDDDTWVVERETIRTKRIELVGTDGSVVLPAFDAGWGWGLVPVDGGVLRTANGGLEVVRRDGEEVAGEPAPSTAPYLDRILSISAIADAPEFTPAPAPVEIPTIRDLPAVDASVPVDPEPTGPPATDRVSDTSVDAMVSDDGSAMEVIEAAVPDAPGSTKGTSTSTVVVIAGLTVLLAAGGGWWVVSRRRRIAARGISGR